MRRGRRWVAGLSLACCALAPLAPVARAQTTGHSLVLSGGCGDQDIGITPDPGLSGRITVSGAVRSIASGGQGAIIVEAACGGGGGTLAIRVPPDFPLTIERSSGGGDLRLGDLGGPVTIHLGGGTDLSAGTLSGRLTIETEGGSDVAIATLRGPATISTDGGGDVAVGRIASPRLTLASNGGGDVAVGPGEIDALVATTGGAGDIKVVAKVGQAILRSTGPGDISLATAPDRLMVSSSGPGEIKVAGREVSGSTPADGSGAAARAGRHAEALAARLQAQFGDPGGANGANAAWSGRGTLIGLVSVLLLSMAGVAAGLSIRRRARGRGAPGRPMDPALAALDRRLAALAERTGRLEGWVTSREFELHRDFREIGDD